MSPRLVNTYRSPVRLARDLLAAAARCLHCAYLRWRTACAQDDIDGWHSEVVMTMRSTAAGAEDGVVELLENIEEYERWIHRMQLRIQAIKAA